MMLEPDKIARLAVDLSVGSVTSAQALNLWFPHFPPPQTPQTRGGSKSNSLTELDILFIYASQATVSVLPTLLALSALAVCV